MSKSCKNKLFVATSVDQGNTWVDHEIALPSDNVYPHVKPVCNNKICAFAGIYLSNREERDTLILGVIKDKGNTWTYPTIHDFPKTKLLRINDLSCTDDMCVMVGQYNYHFPIVVTSTDQGETWSLIKVPFSGKGANLYWVLCEGKACVALGEDRGNLGFAYIIRSTDLGISWTKSLTSFVLPYSLTRATCNGNVCALAGYYNVYDPGKISKEIPFVAVSQDQGRSWLTPLLPWLKERAYLSDISCSNNRCIAVGSLDDEKALLAISRDNGLTWYYQKDLPVPITLLSSEIKSYLNYIHCTQDFCIAGGSYSDKFKHTTPWLILSQDGGETWISPSTVVSELPVDFTGGAFLNGDTSDVHLALLKSQLQKKDFKSGNLAKNSFTPS